MKKLFIIILILCYSVSFAQDNSEFKEILGLVIEQFEKESIIVYSKFENSEILEELERNKSVHDSKILDSLGTDFGIVSPKVLDDTVTINMDKMRVIYSEQKELVTKTSNKKLNRFLKRKFEKNRKIRPLAFISFPILSADKKEAIVYGYYVCGNLCGEGGTFYLEKENNEWRLRRYLSRWIS